MYVISLSALFRDESRPREVNLLSEIQSILFGFCIFPLLPMKHLSSFNRFIACTVCQPSDAAVKQTELTPALVLPLQAENMINEKSKKASSDGS